MPERIFSHLNKTFGKRSESLRSVVPHQIVEQMGLTDSDQLEWVIVNKRVYVEQGEIIVKKL